MGSEMCIRDRLDTIKVPSPDCYQRPDGMSWEEHSRNMFAAMEQTLAENHDSVAAVIVEPLIQGAGGMRMYHPVYLKLLREACDRYGVHLILDEIAVGFGRTGTMFACEQAGIRPDFLCLSKALTGGYLPLAAIEPVVKAHFQRDFDAGRTVIGVEHPIQAFRGHLHQTLGQLDHWLMAETGQNYVLELIDLILSLIHI